jgi:hypothetical protein
MRGTMGVGVAALVCLWPQGREAAAVPRDRCRVIFFFAISAPIAHASILFFFPHCRLLFKKKKKVWLGYKPTITFFLPFFLFFIFCIYFKNK